MLPVLHTYRCTSSSYRNTPRHGEQPPNQDLLCFPGTTNKKTSPASGRNFRLSHRKKVKLFPGFPLSILQTSRVIRRAKWMKTRISTNKTLRWKSKSDWSYSCLFKAAVLAVGSLQRYLCERNQAVIPHAQKLESQSCLMSPQDLAQQNEPAVLTKAAAEDQPRRPASATPVASRRIMIPVSSTPWQRCVATTAPIPHT